MKDFFQQCFPKDKTSIWIAVVMKDTAKSLGSMVF